MYSCKCMPCSLNHRPRIRSTLPGRDDMPGFRGTRLRFTRMNHRGRAGGGGGTGVPWFAMSRTRGHPVQKVYFVLTAGEGWGWVFSRGCVWLRDIEAEMKPLRDAKPLFGPRLYVAARGGVESTAYSLWLYAVLCFGCCPCDRCCCCCCWLLLLSVDGAALC